MSASAEDLPDLPEAQFSGTLLRVCSDIYEALKDDLEKPYKYTLSARLKMFGCTVEDGVNKRTDLIIRHNGAVKFVLAVRAHIETIHCSLYEQMIDYLMSLKCIHGYLINFVKTKNPERRIVRIIKIEIVPASRETLESVKMKDISRICCAVTCSCCEGLFYDAGLPPRYVNGIATKYCPRSLKFTPHGYVIGKDDEEAIDDEGEEDELANKIVELLNGYTDDIVRRHRLKRIIDKLEHYVE